MGGTKQASWKRMEILDGYRTTWDVTSASAPMLERENLRSATNQYTYIYVYSYIYMCIYIYMYLNIYVFIHLYIYVYLNN